jgi:hypothetical protein
MLWEYRGEQWSLLLTHTLLKALDCVYMSPSVAEFIALAIEAQGTVVTLEADQKSQLFQNIFKVLKVKLVS